MTTLTDIRQQYPQYRDLSDSQLADALYQKFYADMPRQEFDAKLGMGAGDRVADEGMDIIRAGIPGNDAFRAKVQERDRLRNEQAAAERKKFLESRSPLQRLAGTAAFFGDIPFRALTQGKKGFADLVEAAGSESGSAAVRQSQQDFVRANPDLVWTMGAAGEVGAGVPALSTMGALGRLPPGSSMRGQLNALRAQTATDDLAAFQRQGVRPPAPAFASPRIQNLSSGVSEVSFVGAPLANALDDSLMGIARASEQIAQRYAGQPGPAPGAEQAGRVVRQGLERYKNERGILPPNTPPNMPPAAIAERTIAGPPRNTSMKTRQDALYEKAWNHIPEWMRDGASRRGENRLMIPFPQTRGLLQQIQERNNRMVVGGETAPIIETSGFTSKVVDGLMNSHRMVSLDAARNIRSRMRYMLSSLPENERNALSRGDIKRIESALTQDIINGMSALQQRLTAAGRTGDAAAIGRSIDTFRRADRYTRQQIEMMERVSKLFKAPDDAALFRNIVTAAKQGDLEKLRSLRLMLRRDEMDQISSALISQMGQPVASARGVVADVGFSPTTFATNWNKLIESNPQAINYLFPNRAHRQALTDLSRMSERLSRVEAMRNTSRSAPTAANMGMLTGSGAMYGAGGWEAAIGAAAGTGAFSVLMSQPATARWLVRYAQLKNEAANNPLMMPQLQAHVATLGMIGARDTANADVYRKIIEAERGAR